MHTTVAAHIRCGQDDMAPRPQNARGLRQKEMRIKRKMLKDLHPQNHVKFGVAIGHHIALNISRAQLDRKIWIVRAQAFDGLRIRIWPFPDATHIDLRESVGDHRLKSKRRKHADVKNVARSAVHNMMQGCQIARPVGS